MNYSKTISCQAEKWLLHQMKKERFSLIQGGLYLFSLFFRGGVSVRNALFDCKILPQYKSKKPVISIGNIIAGGSGKTPFTHLLGEAIGRPFLLLHRGYRATKKGNGEKILSADYGDEAFMLSQKLPLATVVVGKNRVALTKRYEESDVSYILLDDGMQYRYLKRDLNLVVLHKNALFGGGDFLPRGTLRDSPKSLKRADVILINGVKTLDEFALASSEVKQYTTAPIIGGAYRIENPEEIEGKKIGAFCGIGGPEEFFRMLHSLGVRILDTKVLADHEPFPEAHTFIQDCFRKGAELVVCTEKDFVKLPPHPGVIPLRIRLEVLFGQDHYEKLLATIHHLLRTDN